MEHTKIILVTGDSHTWGQGSGGENALEQPLVPGELRPLSFECPSYVNLLRAKIGTLTGSEALEYQGKALMELAHGRERHGSALLLEGDSLVLPKKASVYRICFQGQEEESRAQVRLGGRCYGECGLSMLASQYMYCFYPVLCQEEEMELEIRCTAGSVLIYRIEAYRGPFAVINGGIGSCPLVRYLAPEIWEPWVAAWKPYAVVAEGNTINDWLTRESPEEYGKLLTWQIEMIRQLGAAPFLHTVSPILGEQAEPFSAYDYSSLVEKARLVAKEEKVPLADTNRAMEQMLSGLDQEQKERVLFTDPWHPNPRGHEIYAQQLLELLNPFLLKES